jgi:threonyl-tRNA synthetase
MGKKVRKASGEKIPYIVVIGDREAAGEIWTIRVRGQEEQIKLMPEDFKNKMLTEIKKRQA